MRTLNEEVLKLRIAATQDYLDWSRRQMFFMSLSEKDMWYRIAKEKIAKMCDADRLKLYKD